MPDLIRSTIIRRFNKDQQDREREDCDLERKSFISDTVIKNLQYVNDTTIRVKDIFGFYEGKIVLQLIEDKRLKDENILDLKGGKPWIVSKLVQDKQVICLYR